MVSGSHPRVPPGMDGVAALLTLAAAGGAALTDVNSPVRAIRVGAQHVLTAPAGGFRFLSVIRLLYSKGDADLSVGEFHLLSLHRPADVRYAHGNSTVQASVAVVSEPQLVWLCDESAANVLVRPH